MHLGVIAAYDLPEWRMPLMMLTATLLLADMHSVASAVRSSAGESPSEVLALRMNRLVTLCIFVVSSSRFFAGASKLSTKRSVSAFCLLMLYRKCVAICPNIVPTSVGRVVVLFVEKGGGNPGGSSGVGFRVWEALVGGLKGAGAGWEKGVVVCGVYFWLRRERHWPWGDDVPAPELKGNPLVSILIPCFNEGENARETIHAALAQTYTNIEVIAINDGSSDDTAQVLDSLLAEDPRLRVIHLAHNQGKAIALRMGAAAARSEYLVCIDGDALLDSKAVPYLVAPLIANPRTGAVTGNPRIRTRSTLVGRVQVGEFSSIIGLIKRTQRVYGQVFTVSGVVAAFRRRALADVGYWSPDMITEDIDISWKLQKHCRL